MPQKKHRPEEIGAKLRQVGVLLSQGRPVAEAIRIDRKLKSTDGIDVLSDFFILHGAPGHARSENGPEFAAKTDRE